MLEITAINKIKINIKKHILRRQYKEIYNKFIKYKSKLNKKIKNERITEYEIAFGFTNTTRSGSKIFNQNFGNLFQEICNSSYIFQYITQYEDNNSFDGVNNEINYELKSRHDTMKQSEAYSEIKPKLELSIQDNKKFYLLILVDNKNESRNIPLHNGCGLKKLLNIDNYNEDNHRWISGDELYKLLFPNTYKEIKQFILDMLRIIKE